MIPSGLFPGVFWIKHTMSILIKDTTREERIEIVRRSLEDCDEGCENFMSSDVDEMDQP